MFDKPIVIPYRFTDDGCSLSPDSIGRTSLKLACRIHDWRYCTRAHAPGELTTSWRKKADLELRQMMGHGMPWYARWTRWMYWWGVRKFGNRDTSFDSCGVDAGQFCRHNMPMPEWQVIHKDGHR
jgi:hypothetical protein